MDKEFVAKIEDIVGDDLKLDEFLAKHSHYKIGGPAKYWADAETAEEIVSLVKLAIEHGVEWVVIGGGTNILVSDAGFDGLVIRAANKSIQIDGESGEVVVEAGAPSSLLARQVSEAGLTGFEWGIGLPGTIGGAVRGNAGCFGGETKDYLVSIEALDASSGEVVDIPAKRLKMGYRDSEIKRQPWIVLRAYFKFEKRDAERNKEEIENVLKCRLTTQPKNAKCAGCAFKNFEYKEEAEVAKLIEVLGDEVPQKFLEDKRIPAGWLIDQAGFKGEKIGGAYITEEHANFLANDGTAKADHVAQLLAAIKTRVRDEYGIQLQEEIQYIGF